MLVDHSNHSPGLHYLIELSGVSSVFLLDAGGLEQVLEDCVKRGGGTVVKSIIHQFNPQGLSGVVVIEESHLAIHTWPELDYAAVDVFTCGEGEVAEGIYREVIHAFAPKYHSVHKLERGPVKDAVEQG